MGTEVDARHALAEIEMNTRQTTTGHTLLAAIEADATSIGYNIIVNYNTSFDP